MFNSYDSFKSTKKPTYTTVSNKICIEHVEKIIFILIYLFNSVIGHFILWLGSAGIENTDILEQAHLMFLKIVLVPGITICLAYRETE